MDRNSDARQVLSKNESTSRDRDREKRQTERERRDRQREIKRGREGGAEYERGNVTRGEKRNRR
ncbi:MAG: hypothetical protein COA48_07910 [Cycloclasticus sp.]|nr:MAG: hypothetical protein COA48_07910 [Cycloclasticus sp.]